MWRLDPVNDTSARLYLPHLLAGGEAGRIASADNVEARRGGKSRRCRSGRIGGNDWRRRGCRRQNTRHDGRDKVVDATDFVIENGTGKTDVIWRLFERWNNGRRFLDQFNARVMSVAELRKHRRLETISIVIDVEIKLLISLNLPHK